MKKFLITLIVSAFIFSCNTKNNNGIKNSEYLITGKITGFPDSTKIFLKNINLDEDIDSTYLVKDTFQFKGKFQQDSIPEQLWLYIKLNKGKDFFYTNLLIRNNDNVLITGDRNDFPDYINRTGSKTQEVANSLNVLTRDLEAKYKKVVSQKVCIKFLLYSPKLHIFPEPSKGGKNGTKA